MNQSDGFNFNTFDIEVYNIEEDVTNCDLLAMLPPNYSIKVVGWLNVNHPSQSTNILLISANSLSFAEDFER